MSNTMKAIRAHDYGGAEQLVLEQAPCPDPAPNQVLVRVFAAGVNPADWKYRGGAYKQFMPLTFPWIPGLEGAGIIEGVGSEVKDLKPGQAVFGTMPASYAEYAAVAASDLHLKPAQLTFDQAATVPIGALTAWQAVIENAGVQAGQHVLVTGAAGGVGLFAVQLARWKGAHVIGTASASNVEYVRSLGAEKVIDYQAIPFENAVRDMDVVIDTVGGETIDRAWKVLKPNGILVTVAGRISEETAKAHGARGMSTRAAPAAKLKEITALIESQKLKPLVGKVFPLAEANKAHALSETGHGRGRIVLHIADK
jgi:NADPH:quinone reductase-like Zn-dependent oxidoreductase